MDSMIEIEMLRAAIKAAHAELIKAAGTWSQSATYIVHVGKAETILNRALHSVSDETEH